jgi:hypothetical protein
MHGVLRRALARERSMTTQSGLTHTFQALPNPRGGAVRIAEMALTDAQHAFMREGDTLGVLRRAIGALHQAGWLPAQRFAETLVLVSPLAGLSEKTRNQFAEALRDFTFAVERRNLRELACSTLLFDHYRGLHALMAAHTRAAPVSFDDLALAGRAIPPATLRSVSPERLARVRAHYERALLLLLRSNAGEVKGQAEIMSILDACLADLAGPDPYDFWRLAGAVVQALRLQPDPDTAADARRLYARFNLILADQAHGLSHAPKSAVRAPLALLWRDYALYGASAEDSSQVDVLRDYGLTVDWHVAGSQASEAVWEKNAEQARDASTRDLGVLRVNAVAYEDFLTSAEPAIGALIEHGTAARVASRIDVAAALKAADAAYRLGAAACALGLGHVALLADTLGLAWRRIAYEAQMVADGQPLDASIPERAAQALGAMLHQAAAGIAPSEGGASVAALTAMIERGMAAFR